MESWDIICEHCGKECITHRPWGKYCSDSCKTMAGRKRRKEQGKNVLRKHNKSLRKGTESLRKNTDESLRKGTESLRKNIDESLRKDTKIDRDFVEKQIEGFGIALKYCDEKDREYIEERIKEFKRDLER